MSSNTEIESLNRQLQNLRDNLRLIDERMSEYVLRTEIPLQLIKEKREAEEQIAALEGQIARRISIFDAPGYAATRARYLGALRERYGVVQTHAFVALAEDERVGSARQLPLLGERGVYIPLAFDAPTARRETAEVEGGAKSARRLRQVAERETKPLALPDVLKLPGHLAIIGDAGAGKTTILHVLATSLAVESPAFLPPDLAQALPDARPLPVLLPLRQFELACGGGKYARTVADLLRFVDDWFAEWSTSANLPTRFLVDHIRAGRAWLLLDALDEVADPDHRLTVRNVIQELARDYPATRIVVTARVAGYRGANLDDRFGVVTVRDLDAEQRERMIRALYRGLDLVDADRLAADLVGRFQADAPLRDLGRTPVMVWTAAVIHALRGTLPEGRAALYDAYVDILLRHSFKRGHFDTQSIDALTEGRGWSLNDRRHLLTYAAFEVHQMLEAQPERRGERQIVIGEDELADTILAKYFRANLGCDQRAARERATDYLGVMVAHSGLIYETPQGYTIGDHLTMQEFLAGCYLGEHLAAEDEEKYKAFLRDKVGASWWREVFLLGAGYLATKPGFYARNFLQTIMAQGESPAGRLAAHVLAARGLLQLRALRHRPMWYDDLARQLPSALYGMLYGSPVEAPAATRHEAGLALGLLHDEAMPDPRFAHPMGLPDFARVDGGWFWMGDDNGPAEERPRHRVSLDTFEMARFPTTNAMYRRFIADGGYADALWWREAIADKRWSSGKIRDYVGERTEPTYWDDLRFNNPAQPVVGVTWYEAAAYCAWLTAKLNDGHTYRLPTEAEWECAAHGVLPSPALAGEGQGVRAYPWGDDWRPDHCNSKESGLGATSPVGIFPKGATSADLHDMVGNVYEWCRDWYGEDYYARSRDAHNPKGPDKGEYRVLRGASWYNEGPPYCRCGFRSWTTPGSGSSSGDFVAPEPSPHNPCPLSLVPCSLW